MSAETYRDDPDSRITNMEMVLDESEGNMIAGVQTAISSLITPFIECKDWSKIAEWNFDSIYGAFYRHCEMCNASFDKTVEATKKATSEDVGTEISANDLERLLFRNKAQRLNIRRAEVIVETLAKEYKKVFGKDYVPKPNRKSATDKDKVSTANKQFLKDQLKEQLVS
tara:strand:+ start:125 stop:631 length:507 start_codon:yes stop_codon:yes gene_type:complete